VNVGRSEEKKTDAAATSVGEKDKKEFRPVLPMRRESPTLEKKKKTATPLVKKCVEKRRRRRPRL